MRRMKQMREQQTFGVYPVEALAAHLHSCSCSCIRFFRLILLNSRS
jgi:hypothetical protein